MHRAHYEQRSTDSYAVKCQTPTRRSTPQHDDATNTPGRLSKHSLPVRVVSQTMCGLFGFFTPNATFDPEAVLHRMSTSLRHRGPDDEGRFICRKTGMVLGHRRLAVQDLSESGHQPMTSAGGRYTIVFNGEIYNYRSLKKSLAKMGYTFRGHSDTEVLLTAIEAWGLPVALQKSTGMFAMAVWDNHEEVLHLARDRIGEKPLYYGWQGKSFLFASELKPLTFHPDWAGRIDRDALGEYLLNSNVPAPRSIYQNIHKLPPACILSIPLLNLRQQSTPPPQKYWSLEDIAIQGNTHPYLESTDRAIDELDARLRDTIRGMMISDVPLGAFLSGGIDSSLVVALMQHESELPIRTFTIGFHDEDFNEAVYAKKVAQHLRTDHTELYITPENALQVIPELPVIFDEPFSDPSQIPTFLVSRLTRQHVTVALSGDGGDEIFCGYPRYAFTNSIWRNAHRLPRAIRKILATSLSIVPRKLFAMPGKAAGFLRHENVSDLYRHVVMHHAWPSETILAHDLYSDKDDYKRFHGMDIVTQLQIMDIENYLQNDILVKVDRAAMSNSLETRAPLLDHRIVEFAFSLPLQMKVRENKGKWILRELLKRYIPERLFERPKMGFSVPIGSWLRGPLRDWAESLLNENRMKQEGYFSAPVIRKFWKEHLAHEQNWEYYLWDILMFQIWLDHTKNQSYSSSAS